jgi:hypothetical protein
MDPLEMILIGPVVAAGILITTFTTVACFRSHARKERDRELFRVYLEDPQKVEAWLVEGAMELVEQILLQRLREEARCAKPRRLRTPAEDAAPMLTAHHQVA